MKLTFAKREDTADRIIAAAGEVFGERGFQGTTIRQITARAGVNVAAVNYHFKNKNELYVRVLMESKKHLKLLVIADFPGSPEKQLEAFIERFVQYLLDPKRPAWHSRVLSMEMSNPTPALSVILRELTVPLYRDVRALIAKIVGGAANPVELDLLANSIIGQCVFYVCSRPMAERLSLHLSRVSNRTGLIASHISSVSLAFLKDSQRQTGLKPSRARNGSNHSLVLS